MVATDGPPLDPTSSEANRWLVAELAKQQYHVPESLWQRFVDWLQSLLREARAPSVAGVPTWLAALVLLLVLAGVAYAVLRAVRLERGPGDRPARSGVLGDTPRTAAEYRTEAADALAASCWEDAVVAGFRAVAAAAVERTILVASPGRTAHETALELGPSFPDEAQALDRAARAFDAVRYGHLRADEPSARDVVDTDRRVSGTRPRFEDRIPG